MKFHKSRWCYWYAYLVVIFLACLAIWFSDRAVDWASWVVGIFALVLFLVFEFVARGEHAVIRGEHIEFCSGLFSKTSHISLKSISHVSVSQSFLQQVLCFGDVHIRTSGGDYLLKCFMEPGKIRRLLSAHEVKK